MKKMMTNMKTLVALLMAGAAVTSCSSDNEMDSLKAPAGKTYTMTVQATKGGDATTRALADGGDGTLTATWATTENVYVKKVDTWATGTLQPQADGATATLKGTLSGVTFAADDVLTLQFPRSGALDYTGQVGTLEDIAAKYDYATATVTVKSVSGGDIIPEAATTTFQHQQAIVKFTLQDKGNSNAAISPSALIINDGTSDIVTLTSIPNATYTTNGAGVLYVALPAVSSKPITLTATVGSDTYTLTTSSSKSFANGSYYRVTAKMTKQAAAPAGAEAVDLGLPSGTKWANMNVGAEMESDYGDYFAWGETTGYTGSDTSHSFDWASYKWDAGSDKNANKYKFSKYLPTTVPYYWAGNGDTPDGKTTLDPEDDAATANWGGDWRMPTLAELVELNNTKSNTTDYTWEWTEVDGHNGWKITSKKSGTSGNSIFLPAAGLREGTSSSGLGSFGYYLSSTLYEDHPARAWFLYFTSFALNCFYLDRYYGFSVRPVQPNN